MNRENQRERPGVRTRRRLLLLVSVASLCLAAAQAQEADHRVGTYRVTDSFEYGYRAVVVDGNTEMYRSSLNYNNGLRLFDGTLRLNSGDGHGRFVDELVLTTFGAGGDPYQSSRLHLEKNRLYRFDMGFRIVNYYNNLLAVSDGKHRFNTERIFQNYDLVVFPQRRIQLLLGYDRNNQNGPALTSESFNVLREQAFSRDQFFVYAENVRRVNNTWRAGANVKVAGFQFSFLQSLDDYKEDPQNSPGVPLGLTTGLVAPSFRRSDPVHGRTPFTRFNVHTDANRLFSVNGRFVYSGGTRNFALDENIANLNPLSGIAVTRQDYVLGAAKRTQGTGDLTLSFQPGQRWTFSNTSSVNQSRISGASAFIEVRQPLSPSDPGISQYFFDILGIRLLSNSTDVSFRPTKKIGFYGGYHYSIRRVESRDILQNISGVPGDVPLFSFQNVLQSGLAGIRIRPLPPLTMLLDVEYGSAGMPFTPVSEKRYHAETIKAQWKRKAWLMTASFKEYHNRNDAPPVLDALEGNAPSSHSYESRQYSAGVAWAPARRFGFDAGYAKLHLNTASGIVNFPLPDLPDVTARRSLYVSNIHHGFATFRADLFKNAVLFLGYSIVKDTADGFSPVATPFIGTGPPAAAPFQVSYPNFRFNGTDLINAYPLTYQAPQAKLTIKLHKKLSWNAGWQYYDYNERYTGLQNYHAHIFYTSLRSGL